MANKYTAKHPNSTRSREAEPFKVTPKLLKEADAATYIGCTVSALQKARCGLHDWPKFFKEPGYGVYYATSDIDEWLANRQRRRTI